MTPASERRNSTAMYNPMLVSELSQNYAGFDWAQYLNVVFEKSGISLDETERVIVVQPDYFANAVGLEASPEVIGE